ncbi:MAG: PHP domain-containing protein, partial [Gemmataceae bacterium]|nr:PHP domain-containing protein [Gemmataceae bacterium]
MKRSPFTALCAEAARLARPRRADLHVHTTASDGEYTPSQVVALARQAGLCAVAVTDHDTLAAVPAAAAAAAAFSHPPVEVVSGVEITTELDGRELHLLGYFVRSDDPELTAALARVCAQRRERFREYVARLGERGSVIPPDRAALVERSTASPGRRHVAGLLIACGLAKTRNEAFHRFLGPLRGLVAPKLMLPVGEAIELVHAAGGVASLAHPPPDFADADWLAGQDVDVTIFVRTLAHGDRFFKSTLQTGAKGNGDMPFYG